jgi:FMN hydrolase / 5-amino-6-(5-phospho-D-ribitylamino)uracil phosphatase
VSPPLVLDGRRPLLLLDVMGTLVRDPFFEEMPAFFGLTLKELLEQKHPRAWVDFEHGHIDEAACMGRFFLDGRTFDVEAFKRHIAEGYAWLPGVRELLEDLRRANVEMHTLSNYTPWYRMIEDRIGLSHYVPWTFVSCETGVRKPSADAYLHAARALGRPPSSCVFVDDRDVNVEGAWKVGMPAIVFKDADSLRADLRSLGIP